MFKKSKQLNFPPTWSEEQRSAQRDGAIKRWKEATAQFSPFECKRAGEERHKFQLTKIVPLFHGTSEQNCHSIAESGHIFFGRTGVNKMGDDLQSREDCDFGSGIYFTNSARYASDRFSKGNIIMSWVSYV